MGRVGVFVMMLSEGLAWRGARGFLTAATSSAANASDQEYRRAKWAHVWVCMDVYVCVWVDVGVSQVKTGTAEGANVVWKLVVGVCREVNEAWMMQWQWLPASAEAGLTVRPPTDPVDPQDGRWEAGAKLSFQGPVKKDPACRPARGAIHALPSSAVQCAVWRIAVCKYIHCTRMYTVL